jgi:hypothetical protein
MNHTVKKLALCSLVSLFASQAYAHTGVRDVVDEGKGSYNGFTITHGCGGDVGTEPFPVLGQSAVFPAGANAVWKKVTNPALAVDPSNLTVIATGGDGGGVLATGAVLSLAPTGYAGFSSAFASTQELVDSLGNVHGLHWKDGAMEPKLNTITPFKITAPMIADNCVKSLKVRIAVVNWCDIEANAANDGATKGHPYKQPKDAFERLIPRVNEVASLGGVQSNVPGAKFYTTLPAGNGDNNRADWWFTALEGGSTRFNDPDVLQPAYWTTLTVNNSAADVTACAGTPYDVYVEPNGADVDAYLTGPNTQPFTKGTTNF